MRVVLLTPEGLVLCTRFHSKESEKFKPNPADGCEVLPTLIPLHLPEQTQEQWFLQLRPYGEGEEEKGREEGRMTRIRDLKLTQSKRAQ